MHASIHQLDRQMDGYISSTYYYMLKHFTSKSLYLLMLEVYNQNEKGCLQALVTLLPEG